MDDLDPPRELPGASSVILKQLESHGLEWDDKVLYQSTRHERYDEILSGLLEQKSAYFCCCSRKEIQAMGGRYDGRCRQKQSIDVRDTAIRVHVPETDQVSYIDLLQGHHCHYPGKESGDFVLRRRDGLYAYQLAVVVDDMDQGITHIIRGVDLEDSTARQLWLQQYLGAVTPMYGHIPVAVNKFQQKLSKQNHASSLEKLTPLANLQSALTWLGIPPLTDAYRPVELLQHALDNWDIDFLKGIHALPAPIEYQ